MSQLLLRVLHIANDGYQASFLLLLPFIAKDLSIDLGLVGTLGSVFYVFEIICALPAGYLAVRFRGLSVLISAMALCGSSYLLLGLSPHFNLIAVLFAVAGVGFGLFHPIAFALVASNAPEHKRGREMGDFTAVGDLGRISLSTLVTFLVVWWGWRTTSLVYGISIVFLLFSALLTIKRIRRGPSSAKSHSAGKTATGSYLSLLKTPRFIFASLAGLLDSAASTPLFVFLPFLLIQKHIEPTVLGGFAGAYFIGNFLGKSLMGRFIDRIGSANTFIVAELLMALCIVLLVLTNSPALIIFYSLVLGVLTKGTAPTRVTMAIESAPNNGSFEKTTALLGLVVSCGTAMAPLLFGLIAKEYGVQASFLFAGFVALTAILPAVLFKNIK